MTTRELLEAAARAAGLGGGWDCLRGEKAPTCYRIADGRSWNPLEDDGDAFRLAVKLKLKVYQGEFVAVVQQRMSHNYLSEEYERNGMDANAATRRAIVRAAAAIDEGRKT